jgi:hypothetical protein
MGYSGAGGKLTHEKNSSKKTRDTVSLSKEKKTYLSSSSIPFVVRGGGTGEGVLNEMLRHVEGQGQVRVGGGEGVLLDMQSQMSGSSG